MTHISEIDVHNLQKLIKYNKVLLIDVREPVEYYREHIVNSINIPLSCILEKIAEYNSATIPIIVICAAGIRSRLVCEMLIKEEYKMNLFNLTGGISAWKNAGLTTQTKNQNVPSINTRT